MSSLSYHFFEEVKYKSVCFEKRRVTVFIKNMLSSRPLKTLLHQAKNSVVASKMGREQIEATVFRQTITRIILLASIFVSATALAGLSLTISTS